VLSLLDAPKVAETNTTFDYPAAKAEVIAVWGPMGSTGKTTLSINVAHELAAAGMSVLLIDADTYSPSLEIQLNLVDHPAGLAAACRLASQDRLTTDEIRRLSQLIEVSGSQIHAMTGISSAVRWPEVTSEKLEKLISVAATEFDYLILDVGSSLDSSSQQIASGFNRNMATHTCLELAHQVIALGLGDPVGIRRYIMARQELQELKLEAEILTVINRVRPSVIGRNPKQQISDTLSRFSNLEIHAFLPDEPETLDRCILESTPIAVARRKSAVRQAISQLVKNHILKPFRMPTAAALAAKQKPCGHGKERNFLTNRCKKITTRKKCPAGKELNKYTTVIIDFINKYGGWQREFLIGASNDSLNVTNLEYKSYRLAETTFNGQEDLTKILNVNGTETIKTNTGWVEEGFKETIKQILLSDRILINNRPAKITTKQVELQKNINNKLINYPLEFQYTNSVI
jgi:MinD-like ATPase involved in chromosome partitioning or flagellar assembly